MRRTHPAVFNGLCFHEAKELAREFVVAGLKRQHSVSLETGLADDVFCLGYARDFHRAGNSAEKSVVCPRCGYALRSRPPIEDGTKDSPSSSRAPYDMRKGIHYLLESSKRPPLRDGGSSWRDPSTKTIPPGAAEIEGPSEEWAGVPHSKYTFGISKPTCCDPSLADYLLFWRRKQWSTRLPAMVVGETRFVFRERPMQSGYVVQFAMPLPLLKSGGFHEESGSWRHGRFAARPFKN